MRDIVDLMNIIGKCVVMGNIRRTAEIAFGDADDTEFINLKNYEVMVDKTGETVYFSSCVYSKLEFFYYGRQMILNTRVI